MELWQWQVEIKVSYFSLNRPEDKSTTEGNISISVGSYKEAEEHFNNIDMAYKKGN